jgi:hypothetical protein
MLIILLKLRIQVETYCFAHENKFKKDILFFKDWKKLRTIKNFLISFTRATFFIKGDFIFINRTLFAINILIKYL